MRRMIPLVAALAGLAAPALADPPEIVGYDAVTLANLQVRLSVAIRHPDSGWDHYADGWRVETAAGEIVAERELTHPHETEQPFTRSLDLPISVEVKPGMVLRAHCSRDGWAKAATPLAP